LLEGLSRLRAQGAQQAFVETDGFRDAAFGLYEAVGFRVQEKVPVYRKEV
jgi:ribosomal protein S18 acetylase RimI-like enzyme